MEFTSALKSERAGKPEFTVFEQDDGDATPFWDGIGGKGTIKDEPSVDRFESTGSNEKVLIRLSDASGKMEFKEEAKGNLSLSILDTNDIFIIDVQSEIFIWIGNKSNVNEKSKAFQYAMNYIKEHNKPKIIPITRVVEGNENSNFKKNFN